MEEMATTTGGDVENGGFLRRLFTQNLGGVIAAVVLAVVVLFIFFRLQMYGPLSALSRFNKYAVDWNPQGILSVTAGSQRNGGVNTQQLAEWVHDVGRQSSKATIVKFRQQGSAALAQVQYTLPDGRNPTMIFVLTVNNGYWRVDPDKSADALRAALGIGR